MHTRAILFALIVSLIGAGLPGLLAEPVDALMTLDDPLSSVGDAARLAADSSGGHPELLGLEEIPDDLPAYIPDARLVRLPRADEPMPLMQSLLSRERYWSEDGHLDVVIRMDPERFHAEAMLSVRILDSDGAMLSAIDITPLPGPRFVIYPALPQPLAGGGAGEILLAWSHGGETEAESRHAFRVERSPAHTARTGRIPIQLSNDEGVVELQAPFTLGVPFPRAARAHPDHIRLVAISGDGTASEIPLQVRETARWSRFGPMKWALCDFSLDLDGTPRRLALEYGPEISRAETEPIRVTPTDGFPGIEAGRLRIDRGVWFDAGGEGDYRKILDENALSGAFVVRADGRRYRAPLDDRYVIEEAGPRKVVLRREGWYREQDTGDSFCLYITRYVIHRDSPLLRIFHTWVFTGDGNRETIANMGWEFPLAGDFRGEGFLGSFDDENDWLDGDRLLQYDYEHFVVEDGAAAYERAGGRSAGVAAAGNDDLRIFLGARDFWQNYPSEMDFREGVLGFHNWPQRNRPAGYTLDGELLTVSGEPALPSAARHAHYEEGKLTLSEWRLNVIQARFAHEGEFLDFRFPDAMARDPIWTETMMQRGRERASSIVDEGRPDTANAQGIARTEEIWLYFAPAAAGREQGARLLRGLNQQTLRAFPDPAWVAASGAFHEIRHKDPETYPEEERVYDLLARFPGRIIERLGVYGMWVYGDIPSYNPNLLRREPRLYRAYRKGHQGWPYTWIPYARSGDPDLLRLADASTRQMGDANYCHYWTEEIDEQSGPHRFRRLGRWHRSPIPWAARLGPSARSYEEKCDFFWHAYYLTGFTRARDLALSWGEQTKREEALPSRGPISIGASNRGSLNLLKSYLMMYEATFDPWFLVASHALADGHLQRLRDNTYRVHGAGRNVQGASHFWRTGDIDYLRFTGRAAYEDLVLAAADFWGDHHARPSWARAGSPVIALNVYAWRLRNEPYPLHRAAAQGDTARVSILDDPELPDYLLGNVPNIGMTRYHGWYMQQWPFAPAAFEEAGIHPAPVYPTFHMFLQAADTEDDAPRYAAPAVVFHKSGGRELPLDFSALSIPERGPKGIRYRYRITGPGEEEAVSGSWDVQERNLVALPAEAPEGIYRLMVAGDTDLREHRLQGGMEVPVTPLGNPEVITWPAGRPATVMAGGNGPVQFWFHVPEGMTSFTVDVASARHRVSIWGPDGDLVWDLQEAQSVQNAQADIPVEPAQAGRLWRITLPGRGHFTLDERIPPVLAASPERWFLPNPLPP